MIKVAKENQDTIIRLLTRYYMLLDWAMIAKEETYLQKELKKMIKLLKNENTQTIR